MERQFKLRVTAIILISGGYGWSGGHFIPSNAPLVAYLFQFLIFILLLVLSLSFFVKKSPWSIKGFSIFAILSLLINVANIIHGTMNHSPSGFGSHNTFADLVPISIIIIGNMLWLLTFLPFYNNSGMKEYTSKRQ